MNKIKSANKEGYALITKSFFQDKYYCLTRWKELTNGAVEIMDDRNRHDVTLSFKRYLMEYLKPFLNKTNEKNHSSKDILNEIIDGYNKLINETNKLQDALAVTGEEEKKQ